MASASCYYPNGKLVREDSPCNPNSKVSMCCGPTDICLSNGLCYVANINALHRGSCTDQSWLSSSCVDICIPGNEDSSFSDLSRCSFGADPNGFICSLDPNDCTDSTKVFNISEGFFADFRNTTQLSSSANLTSKSSTTLLPSSLSSSALVSSISMTHALSTSPSSLSTSFVVRNLTFLQANNCNRQVTAVGAGVGISLGLLSCSFLGAFLWTLSQLRRQRNGTFNRRTAYPSISITPEPSQEDLKYGSKVQLHQQDSYEMKSRRGSVYEVSGSPRAFTARQ